MLKGLKESENQNHNIIVTNEYKEEINYKTPYEQTIEFKKIKEYLRGQNKLVYVTDTIKRLFKIFLFLVHHFGTPLAIYIGRTPERRSEIQHGLYCGDQQRTLPGPVPGGVRCGVQ